MYVCMYLGGLFCKNWLVVDEYDAAYYNNIICFSEHTIELDL